jgi:hypothetical protein
MTKIQRQTVWVIGNWRLGFIWNLGFGYWNFIQG